MTTRTGITSTTRRRRLKGEVRETVELAVIAWTCCLAVVLAIGIPLLGLTRTALLAAGSLLGLVVVCFAIAGARLPRLRHR